MRRIIFKQNTMWGPQYEIQEKKKYFWGKFEKWVGTHSFNHKGDALRVLDHLNQQPKDGEIVYSD